MPLLLGMVPRRIMSRQRRMADQVLTVDSGNSRGLLISRFRPLIGPGPDDQGGRRIRLERGEGRLLGELLDPGGSDGEHDPGHHFGEQPLGRQTGGTSSSGDEDRGREKGQTREGEHQRAPAVPVAGWEGEKEPGGESERVHRRSRWPRRRTGPAYGGTPRAAPCPWGQIAVVVDLRPRNNEAEPLGQARRTLHSRCRSRRRIPRPRWSWARARCSRPEQRRSGR